MTELGIIGVFWKVTNQKFTCCCFVLGQRKGNCSHLNSSLILVLREQDLGIKMLKTLFFGLQNHYRW